jgi:hypothetical protein
MHVFSSYLVYLIGNLFVVSTSHHDFSPQSIGGLLIAMRPVFRQWFWTNKKPYSPLQSSWGLVGFWGKWYVGRNMQLDAMFPYKKVSLQSGIIYASQNASLYTMRREAIPNKALFT